MSIIQQMKNTWLTEKVQKPSRAGWLNLSSNTLMHPRLAEVQKEFLTQINDFQHYPFYENLRADYAKFYQVVPNQLGFTAGSDHLIAGLMSLVKDLKIENIFLQDPYYYNYYNYASALNLKIQLLSFEHLFSEETKARLKMTAPSLIFLTTPCPITGESLSIKALNTWLDELATLGHFVVLDQAYAGFGSEMYLSLLKHESLLIFQTFSKCFGAAGLRFCTYFGNPCLVARLQQCGMEGTISSIAIQYAQYVLEKIAIFKAMQQDICHWRELAYQQWQQDFQALNCYQSKANFISLRLNTATVDEIIERASRKKIFLKHHRARAQSCLRITVAPPTILTNMHATLAEVLMS